MKKIVTPLVPALLGLAAPAALAQNVGIGTPTPNAKAALEISATNKGLLIPRMDSAARVGITSPPTGLMVFQTGTTTPKTRTGFYYYGGGAWLYLPDKTTSGDNLGNHSATQDVALNGNDLKLNAATDDNSKLTYDATAAGPVLTGATGGQLGYRSANATTPVLQWANVSGNGRVGIGLASGVGPSRTLDVGGAVRLRNLTTAGVVTTDANGVLGSEANQTLSITGQTLSISGTGGNSVTLPSGGGAPSGTAGGDLTGAYPNPTVATAAIGTAKLADNAVTNAKVADDAIGIAELSATGTPSSSTYLRGDNTWATIAASTPSWSLSGNAVDGNAFIGSTNNEDFIVKRNNNEAFRIYGNGRISLGNNTQSSASVLLGFNAGFAQTTAVYNVVIGARAGEAINSSASTFVGYAAGQNTTGGSNTLIGYYAGNKLTTGTNNVFIGNQTAYNSNLSITGTNNVVIGTASGSGLTTNTNNILFGGNAQATAGLYDAYAFGNNATVSQGNALVIGNVRGTNDAVSVGIGTAEPNSSLQVNGTFAVGVVNGFGGGTNGGPNGLDQGDINNTTLVGGYYGLTPGTNSNYYQLPAANSCPGRIYYLRNNSTGTSAFLLSAGGSIYGASSASAVSSSTGYELRPTAASKTVIAISDGTNWTVGYIN